MLLLHYSLCTSTQIVPAPFMRFNYQIHFFSKYQYVHNYIKSAFLKHILNTSFFWILCVPFCQKNRHYIVHVLPDLPFLLYALHRMFITNIQMISSILMQRVMYHTNKYARYGTHPTLYQVRQNNATQACVDSISAQWSYWPNLPI